MTQASARGARDTALSPDCAVYCASAVPCCAPTVPRCASTVLRCASTVPHCAPTVPPPCCATLCPNCAPSTPCNTITSLPPPTGNVLVARKSLTASSAFGKLDSGSQVAS